MKELDNECKICPYCLGIAGVGPNPSHNPRTPFDHVLHEGPEVVLVPTLGMIIPGWFLIISKEHACSYASLNQLALSELEEYTREVVLNLKPLFGDYLVFEHGDSKYTKTAPHGGCISHAHFHLIPAAKEIGHYVMKALSWKPLSRLSDLSCAEYYAYALVGLDEKYFLAKSPNLPSQWIRKVVVEAIALAKHWDWGVDFGYEELNKTVSVLENANIQMRGKRVSYVKDSKSN